MKIKAAVVREKGGPFLLEEIELDEPRADEILVRIVSSGLCHTDLVARMQYLPIPLPGVFGHEGAGVVEKVGSQVTAVKPGDHVATSYMSCGVCPACKTARPAWCAEFRRLNFGGRRNDGTATMKKGTETIYGSFFGQSTFATHALVTERNVVKVRQDVPLEILSPMGCGIQTGAGGVFNSLKPEPGSNIVIFGIGPVGISAIMAAVINGCTSIIAVDIQEERLKLAKEFGATDVINSSQADAVEEIRKLTDGGAQYTLECTGIPAVFRQSVDCLRMGGVCGLIGVAPVGMEAKLEMQTILDGRTIKGVVEGDSVSELFIPQLIEFYRLGRFPFDRLLTFYPLDKINEAVEDAEKGRVMKAILKP
ncbi:MAG: NAD(P)-dependent alcohol dehydrogenase [Acidobacteriota bacterium]|mgnify:CR=1 FL=1|jgi:aryl-alcohol dehydrogenase|nr:NAD(P)-dependent alcohol dehydrogenase [Acidobacteriota bacterium]NLT32179.1 NAD(P)-dependent alcohol dehydrogenase [Acidobacteriota bacterium]